MASYNLLTEFSDDPAADDISSSPHWVIAVVQLNKPLSYSRKDKASVTLDVSEGAKTRGPTLVITSDCVSLGIQGSKESHLKNLQATLVQSDTNYLVEILPGDWCLAWIVHTKDKADDLVNRIRRGEACNGFDDGLKFVGRIEAPRKAGRRNRSDGKKTVRYSLRAYGFRELDTQVFYDRFLAENSIESNNLGRWLAKVGLDIRDLFALTASGEQEDNVHLLISAFLELLVGRGIAQSINATTDEAALQAFTGGGPAGLAAELTESSQNQQGAEAPFAYLVPQEVGDLLGKRSRSKKGGILAYADVIELVFGVQAYDGGSPSDWRVFVPSIDFDSKLTKGNQKFTGKGLMGAHLPNMPSFSNTPLWSLLQQYLNPVVNEMFTCLRVNNEGKVVPTVVLRQIPFTSAVLQQKMENGTSTIPGDGARGINPDTNVGTSIESTPSVPVTPFMSLPRWSLPGVLVDDYDIGRSDSARINFVHVYGQDADIAKTVSITAQLVQNPPIRDDFDIQRSGLHAFMATTACRQINQVGTTPGVWMELIADWTIGMQWTLNGSINCVGIQAPICEGDNVEFDGVVYHIESVGHQCQCDPDGGNRSWSTSLTVTNGLRADDSNSDTNEEFPIYPGFKKDDGTGGDPGVSSDPAEVPPAKKTEEAPPFDPNQGNA